MKEVKVLLREFRLDAPAPGDSSHALTLPEDEARELLAQLQAVLGEPRPDRRCPVHGGTDCGYGGVT